MAKCIRCGKSTLVRGHIKLKDADLCTPCFKELGFERSDYLIANMYSYNDIKDGRSAYNARKSRERAERERQERSEQLGLHFSDYALLKDLGCSDNEVKAVERVCALLDDESCNPNVITYEREPGRPLTAFIGDGTFYQLRYTNEIKWIKIGDSEDKIRITGPAGINKSVNKLVDAYEKLI